MTFPIKPPGATDQGRTQAVLVTEFPNRVTSRRAESPESLDQAVAGIVAKHSRLKVGLRWQGRYVVAGPVADGHYRSQR